MEAYCCYNPSYDSMEGRKFLTREEKIALLEEYKERLDSESKGVGEKISELKSKE